MALIEHSQEQKLALNLAMCRALARRDGLDYDTVREFGTFEFDDPSTHGPSKDTYERESDYAWDPAEGYFTPEELVVIYRSVVPLEVAA